MKSISDASATYHLFKRLKALVYDVIRNVCILDLTNYEVGNAIWVEAVRGLISDRSSLFKAWANIFKTLAELEIEDVADVEEIALKLNLKFYDASYIYVTYKKKLTIVTEMMK